MCDVINYKPLSNTKNNVAQAEFNLLRLVMVLKV